MARNNPAAKEIADAAKVTKALTVAYKALNKQAIKIVGALAGQAIHSQEKGRKAIASKFMIDQRGFEDVSDSGAIYSVTVEFDVKGNSIARDDFNEFMRDICDSVNGKKSGTNVSVNYDDEGVCTVEFVVSHA